MDDTSEFVKPVVRLTFRARPDGSVELVDQQRLAMAFVPTTDDPGEPPVGFWHELRDGDGRVLHRRLMRNPLSDRIEVPTGNPNEPLPIGAPSPGSICSLSMCQTCLRRRHWRWSKGDLGGVNPLSQAAQQLKRSAQ